MFLLKMEKEKGVEGDLLHLLFLQEAVNLENDIYQNLTLWLWFSWA